MKVSEKQLLVMLDALHGSCHIASGGTGLFSYDQETRQKMFHMIINQQSDVLVEVKGEEPQEVAP